MTVIWHYWKPTQSELPRWWDWHPCPWHAPYLQLMRGWGVRAVNRASYSSSEFPENGVCVYNYQRCRSWHKDKSSLEPMVLQVFCEPVNPAKRTVERGCLPESWSQGAEKGRFSQREKGPGVPVTSLLLWRTREGSRPQCGFGLQDCPSPREQSAIIY